MLIVIKHSKYVIIVAGLMYKQGQGVKQDLQKAVEYFRKGAEKG